MRKRKIVTIIRRTNRVTAFVVKLVKELRNKGYKVNIFTFFELVEDQKSQFDDIFYLVRSGKKVDRKEKMNNILRYAIFDIPRFLSRIFELKKTDISIGISCYSNYFTAFGFFLLKKTRKIYFPYDIAFFRFKDRERYPLFFRISEQSNFRCCNRIIHKGPENELSHLPKNFGAKDKPSLQFLPYCSKKNFLDLNKKYLSSKISKKIDGTHLVYVGGIYHDYPGQFNTIEVFKKIISQNLHLHIYSQSYESIINTKDYQDLQKNDYFHLHKPIYGKNFLEKIAKYDWGIMIFHTNFSSMKKEWAETQFGNKISSYIEAGLPSIVLKEMAFTAKIVEENDFGIVVEDEADISEKINEVDYTSIVNKILRSRELFTIEQNIQRFYDFIESD